MKPVTEIPALQSAIVTYAVTLGTLYFPAASVVVPQAGPAGWISIALAFILSLPWAAMAVWVSRQAPVGDWGRAVITWLGPFAGRAFLLYFVVTGTWFGGLLLSQVGLVFHVIALPATPPLALMLALLALILLTDLRGIEVYVRTVQMLVLISLPLMAAFFYAVVPSSKIANLLPVLGEGPGGIARATVSVLAWPMEGILFILFISTMVRKKKGLFKYSAWAILLAGFTLVLITALTLGVLGRGVTEAYIYPTVPLIQSTMLGDFLQGLEVFVYPLWLLTGYIKAAIPFVVVSESLRGIWQGIGQPYRALGIALAFLAVALVPQNVSAIVDGLTLVDNTLILAAYAIIPFTAIIIWIKKRGERHDEET